MSFEIVEERVNPLMGRREAKLVVHHEGTGTPDRIRVRKLASEHFNAPIDQVFVKSISTRTGGSSALCAVEVYDNEKIAEKSVPAYLKNRNLPKEQRVSVKKSEESKPPAPPVAKPAKKETEPKPQARPETAKEAKSTDKGTKTQPKTETKTPV